MSIFVILAGERVPGRRSVSDMFVNCTVLEVLDSLSFVPWFLLASVVGREAYVEVMSFFACCQVS